MRTVYLNGAYVPENEARISVFDRGLLFGDSLYELIPFYQGVGFRLQEHLERLERGLKLLRIPLTTDLATVAEQLWERNGGGNLSVYLQVTRGVAGQRSHAIPEGLVPTVIGFTQPIPAAQGDRQRVEGIAAITVPDQRWLHCDLKATTLLPNILALQQALDAGAQEALMVRDGFLTEGSSCNLFLVRSGVIYTPELGRMILGGTTRDVLLGLAHKAALPCREVPVPVAWLEDADELWISSSTRGLIPVLSVNGHPVGAGHPGGLWQQMAAHFGAFQRRVLQSGAAD